MSFIFMFAFFFDQIVLVSNVYCQVHDFINHIVIVPTFYCQVHNFINKILTLIGILSLWTELINSEVI